MKRVLLMAACAAMFLSFGMAQASAQDGLGLGYGYGYGYGNYPLYGRDHIPYYALHPPVYYSYPVPRPYGWSPFAYPGTVQTPDVDFAAAIAPKTIENPEVRVNKLTRSTADSHTTAIEPIRIVNPFVSQTKLASERRDVQ